MSKQTVTGTCYPFWVACFGHPKEMSDVRESTVAEVAKLRLDQGLEMKYSLQHGPCDPSQRCNEPAQVWEIGMRIGM